MRDLKYKGQIVSIYVKDKTLMDKIREQCAKDNRTISNWGYLAVKKAALGDDNVKENGGKSAGDQPRHSTT
jgi:hypothetical protein